MNRAASHRAESRARIEHDLNGCPPAPFTLTGPRPGAEWITISQAHGMLDHRAPSGLAPFKPLQHVVCAAPPHVPGRRPYLVKRRDVERMRLLMREAGLSAQAAARVVAAENEGRI